MICTGCGQPGATQTHELHAPLGLTYTHTHPNETCKENARLARGGGHYTPPSTPPAGELFPRETKGTR